MAGVPGVVWYGGYHGGMVGTSNQVIWLIPNVLPLEVFNPCKGALRAL